MCALKRLPRVDVGDAEPSSLWHTHAMSGSDSSLSGMFRAMSLEPESFGNGRASCECLEFAGETHQTELDQAIPVPGSNVATLPLCNIGMVVADTRDWFPGRIASLHHSCEGRCGPSPKADDRTSVVVFGFRQGPKASGVVLEVPQR